MYGQHYYEKSCYRPETRTFRFRKNHFYDSWEGEGSLFDLILLRLEVSVGLIMDACAMTELVHSNL